MICLLILKKRENRMKQKKKKKKNRKGGRENHPSTPSKFFQIQEVKVTIYPSNLLYEVLGCIRRKPEVLGCMRRKPKMK